MDEDRPSFAQTEMQLAVFESSRRGDASFTIRVGKCGTAVPYQQTIPMAFAKYYEDLYFKTLTLQGPTGRAWTAVIRPSYRYKVRFSKGWRQFSLDNHLQVGYHLMFTLLGSYGFLVRFFDRAGKECMSYPPLPVAHPPLPAESPPTLAQGRGSPVAENPSQRRSWCGSAEPGLQDPVILRRYGFVLSPESPGPQPRWSHEQTRELEGQTSADRAGFVDLDIDAEETEALGEANNHTSRFADTDSNPPATFQKQPLVEPERNIYYFQSKEFSLSQPTDFLSRDSPAPSPPPPTRDHSKPPSSDDELPVQDEAPSELQETPASLMNFSERRPADANFHTAAGSSRGSRAMSLLCQQRCRNFSEIVSKSERRDVSVQGRRRVVDAARRFGIALEMRRKFLVVMTKRHVYRKFCLHIPEKFLQLPTGETPACQGSVCLVDREQTLYEGHWSRESASEPPFLECDVWAQFALDHALEEGDVCVFLPLELESAPSGSLTHRFRVHIFRVVETPPLPGRLHFTPDFVMKSTS